MSHHHHHHRRHRRHRRHRHRRHHHRRHRRHRRHQRPVNLAPTQGGAAAHRRSTLEAVAAATGGPEGAVFVERFAALGGLLCGNQPLVWVVLTKLENSLARSNRSRFG